LKDAGQKLGGIKDASFHAGLELLVARGSGGDQDAQAIGLRLQARRKHLSKS
jgi:hypothetical protein